MSTAAWSFSAFACALVARRPALVLLLLAALGGLATAQSQARVSARLSSAVVKLGSEVTLVVTVENASFCEVRPPPAVDGLRIGAWSGPEEHRLVQTINGRTSVLLERTWAATVVPERKGDFTIPPLELTVDGSLVRAQPLSLNVVEDLKGEELGTFELRASKPRVVEGEPFTITLTFGWDVALADQINWANLALSWWGQLAGAIENDPPPPPPGMQQVDINLNSSETVRIERLPRAEVRGRTFVMFRLARSFTATRAGALEFPTSWLEFGRVEEVGQLFTRRRERVESYFVRSQPLSIDVVPLPEAGRPPDFGGAIGTFKVRASADPRDVDAGESIKLQIEWTGTGNLEFFSAPEPSRTDAFGGFRVYGKTETKAPDRRTVTYDLAPKSSSVKQIPPIVLPVFDPEAGRYATVATEPIAINVRALSRASGLGEAPSGFVPGSDLRDVESALGSEPDLPAPADGVLLAAFAALPCLALGLARVARRRRDPWSALERSRRRATRRLRADLARSDGARGELESVLRFLGARTAEPPEAWQGRDLGPWFARHAASVPPETVRELDALVRELDGAAWGGAARPAVRERALALAGRLVEGGL